ncbi:Forkhead box protein D4-like 1 [Tulasnella sp. 424]|nr:Forkhead box protein D4-like 1 [Tulasnella sp. 424]KAG8964668.1 Forkhead box protein D4-like 1 [Tulasnella sp. 425]
MVKEEPQEEVSLNGPDSAPAAATSSTPASDAGPSVPPRSSQHPSLTYFLNPAPPPPPHPPFQPQITKQEPQDDRSTVKGGFLDKNFRPALVATSHYHGQRDFPPVYGDRELPPLKARHTVTPYPIPLYYYPPALGPSSSAPTYPPPPILAPRRSNGATPSTASPPPLRSRSKPNSPHPTPPPSHSSPRAHPTPPPTGSAGSSADAYGDPDELYDDELENVQSADLDGVPLGENTATSPVDGNPHPRPPYSACMMIRQILVWSPQGKLRSAQLCDAIADKYPFFQDPVAKKHLRDSVRHKLSNRPQFHCLPKEPGDKGKGGYWEYVFKDGSTSSTISWDERQRRMEEGTKKRQMKQAQEQGVEYVNEQPMTTG